MDTAMKLIYIAGPYTAPTACQVAENVQEARRCADAVARLGAFPVTPHLLGAGIEDAGSPDFWYDGTMEVLRRCDAVLLTSRWEQSTGARREKAEAERLGKLVFRTADGLACWLEGR